MFKFHCDRCEKLIKEVSGAEAKEIMLSNDTICKSCHSKEAKFDKLADKIKRVADRRVNEVIAEVKTEIQAALKDI